jgi:Na+-translocating ferredoxin:NAD+ oxidoreductase subunit B
MHNDTLIDKIDKILPQTQCTRCSYPSCRDYAVAIANEEAKINQCPPGGDLGIEKLARLLDKPVIKLNPQNGSIKPKTLAVIDEDVCIGCALCIKACPVDAIIGTNKMAHTVLSFECTGCDLCIPACPVDCIHVIEDPDNNWSNNRINLAKTRYDNRNIRIKQERLDREARLKAKSIK